MPKLGEEEYKQPAEKLPARVHAAALAERRATLDSLTLARIERVDFDLFLANLDWDDAATASRKPGLKSLEAMRRATLKRAAARAPLAQAWESVRDIEAEMLARLK